jgi:hypothetical protein
MKTEQIMSIVPIAQITASEPHSHTFNKIVLETIDEVFTCFGNNCKQAIYRYLQNQCNIPRTEIPTRAQEFSNALETLFGPGAGLIEIEIMKRLSSRVPEFKHSPIKSNLSFGNYLSSLNSFL